MVACDEYIYTYACDESASKDWPRESVRGMQSMAKAVAWLGLGLGLGLELELKPGLRLRFRSRLGSG